MTPIILIPARMASTRLPGKPLALIAGRPMILHMLAIAQAAALGPVVVACAEAEIAQAVQDAGGTAILTDPALPSGTDRIAAALHTLGGDYDTVINLQGDFPTLPPSHIAAALLPLQAGYDIGTLVTAATAEDATNPAVVKAACAFVGPVAPALYFSRAAIPAGPGPLWHHIGIYAYTRPALERFVGLPPSLLEQREQLEQLRALEAGMRIGVTRVTGTVFGVDTPAELARAKAMLL